MHVIRRVFRGISSANMFCLKGYRFFPIAMMLIMLYGVILRYVFQSATIWSYELTGMLMGPFWLFAAVINLVRKDNIKLDILYHRLSLRKRAIIDAFTWLFFWFYIGVVLYYGWQAFVFSFTHMQTSKTLWGPFLWPWRLCVPVACALLLLQGIVRYGGIIYTAITGKELEL